MADFTVIETQEQFDAAIKDRLGREKAKFAEQLAGYDETKAKLSDAEKQIADLTEALTAANEKVSGFNEQIRLRHAGGKNADRARNGIILRRDRFFKGRNRRRYTEIGGILKKSCWCAESRTVGKQRRGKS